MTRLSIFDLCVNEHYSLNILNELNALHLIVYKSRAIGDKFINKLILIGILEQLELGRAEEQTTLVVGLRIYTERNRCHPVVTGGKWELDGHIQQKL